MFIARLGGMLPYRSIVSPSAVIKTSPYHLNRAKQNRLGDGDAERLSGPELFMTPDAPVERVLRSEVTRVPNRAAVGHSAPTGCWASHHCAALGTSSTEKYTAFPCCLASAIISSAPSDGPPIRKQASHFAMRRRAIG